MTKTLFENFGIKIAIDGSLSEEELSILQYEINSTIASILKNRKFGGEGK